MEIIKLSNLSIGYGQNVVVSDITASLHSGQLTCLLGANGAGKSTLLRTLSAFQSPLFGEIEIGNTPINELSQLDLACKIGVVLTEKMDLRNITVEELVGLGRSPYTGFWGNLRATDREIVAEAIDMVGMTPLAYRQIQTLSDGERQKAMIAKALAQQTPIIILD